MNITNHLSMKPLTLD